MKNPFWAVLAILLLAACIPASKRTQTPSLPHFPQDWLGYWTGDLYIYTAKGAVDTVPMALNHVAKNDSTWAWEIIYNKGVAGKEETRAYELHAVDAAKGHYYVDEKDGILLDSYVRGNALISRFEVMGSLLESVERIENAHTIEKTLIFEIFSGNSTAIRTSGDTIIGKDTIPPVKSFAIPVMQRAELRKNS